jgi:hypothetical protein
LGKVTEDHGKASGDEHGRVLQPGKSRSNLTDDSAHLLPEAGPGAVDSGTVTADGDVLARKASRNHINNASPWFTVKTAHVRPNRERREKSIVLSLRQNLCGVGITLNGADGTPAKQAPVQYSATSAREKSQLIHHRSCKHAPGIPGH